MGTPIQIEGCEGQNIEVRQGFWAGAQLLINCEKAPKGSNRREMLVKRNDGVVMTAYWKPRLLGFDTPNLVINGKEIEVNPPLKWYEIVWSALPVIMVFIGGALGAVLGILGFTASAAIFRSKLNGVVKYLFSALVTGTAVILWLIISIIVSSALA